MADRPEMFGPTRGFSGMADSMEPCKCCGADPCCHGNEIWARRGDPVAIGLLACLYLRLSRCSFKSLLFFLDGTEPFFGRQFSMWHCTKLFSSIFDLGPLTPKIYSPKFGTKSPISRLVWQIHRRCLGLVGGFRGWPIQRMLSSIHRHAIDVIHYRFVAVHSSAMKNVKLHCIIATQKHQL